MQNFYQDLLGFRWSDTVGDFFVFPRCNGDHLTKNGYGLHWGPGRHGPGHNSYHPGDAPGRSS
jgi:hypothetical protein